MELWFSKIFFDNLTIDGVLMFLKKSEEQLKKTVENINKIKNKENIDIKEFNNIYNNLKIILNKFDSICNIEDSYYDNDLKNYSNYLKKNVNTFKKNFNIFSEKYNNIPKVDTDKIFMKDFSLPVLKDTKYDFNLNDIEDNPIILSRPLIIKKIINCFVIIKKYI